MWALQWRYSKLRTVGVGRMGGKGERLLFTIGRTQIFDELECRRLAQIVVEAKGLEIIRVDPRDEPELHAPAHHLINEGDFLGQTQRVVQRNENDVRRRSRNRTRVRHTVEARAITARNVGADSCPAYPRHGKNGRTSLCTLLKSLPRGQLGVLFPKIPSGLLKYETHTSPVAVL